jgi:hypothetical protein
MNIFKSFEGFFLAKINADDFVLRRKGQIILYLHTAFIAGLVVMMVAGLGESATRLRVILITTIHLLVNEIAPCRPAAGKVNLAAISSSVLLSDDKRGLHDASAAPCPSSLGTFMYLSLICLMLTPSAVSTDYT